MYSQEVLPHAKTQLQNFMLACMAEGRNHDREDEGAFRRGDAMTCELTCLEISDIMNATKKADELSVGQDSTTCADPRAADVPGANGHAKRIAATTTLALRLADASKCDEQSGAVSARTLLRGQRAAPPVLKPDSEQDAEILRDWVVTLREHDWQAAYAQ